MANFFKRKTLRDKCRDLYGDDFVFQYDMLCSGVPIGTMEETISFLKDIDAAQKVSNKTRRRLKKDKLLYDEGFHDGKRDAMKWINVKERLPEEDGEYLVVLGRLNDKWGPSVDLRHFAKDMSKCFSCNGEYASLPGWYFHDSEYGDVEDNGVMYWVPKPDLPEGINTGM